MSDTTTRITVASLNCRGLKKVLHPSGRSLARHIRSLSYDLIALQETHADSHELHSLFATCHQVRSSTWTQHCGLISYNAALEVTAEWASRDGRLLVARVSHHQQLCADFFVYVIYAPATESARPPFFAALHQLLNFDCPPQRRSICLGDFNHNYHTLTTHSADMTRWLHWARGYWHDPHHTSAFRNALPTYRHISTIDFIMLTPDLADSVSQPDNRHVARCDHAVISASLSIGIPATGPGIWRFNTQFLAQPLFCQELDAFMLASARYLDTTDAASAWDLFKSMLKKFSQDFGRKRQRCLRGQRESLQRQRKICLRQMQDVTSDTSTDAPLARLGRIEAKIDRLDEQQADTLALRSGLRWREDGERSTAYFYRCLRTRQQKQHIAALQQPNGRLVTMPTGLLHEAQQFYQRLYTAEPVSQPDIVSLLTNVPPTVFIPPEQQSQLVSEWTADNLFQALRRTPTRSSPGIDGIPYELLRHLCETYDFIRLLFLAVLNSALLHNRFSATWQRSVVILLPKKRDRTQLKNWRPISLICADAKLFTRLLANRFNPVTHDLIDPHQTGFMANRFIADNGLTARLIMDIARRHKLPDIGLLLDQDKAYDRVHPQYLHACLLRFGFPPSLVSCLRTLFFDTTLCININSFLSAPCPQGGGLRQGDPLSPLLFNLVLEPLLCTIRANSSLPGFRFLTPDIASRPPAIGDAPEVKAMAYADDILVLLSKPHELATMLSIFGTYGRASNARLNKDKTVAISLSGQAQAVWRRTLRDTGITQWHDKASSEAVIYLGYPLTSTPSQLATYLELVLAKVKQYAQSLSQRRLSIAGRGLVVNSLLLSRVWHTIRILTAPQTFLSKLRSVAIQFLAHKAFPAVSFATCTRPRKEGGLGVLDPFDQHAALQLRWVLPLLHVECDHPDTFVLPILRYCIKTVSGTTDAALALGFNECHTAHLKALSSVKAMLSTATKLGLQSHFESYGPAIVLELPILVLCPDLPHRPLEPGHSTAYQWHTLLVKDTFYFQQSLGKFRRLLPSYRGARTRLINILFQHLDTRTAHITAPLLRWFDESVTTTSPQHPLIFNARQIFRSKLTSGIDLNEMTSKKFRHTQCTPSTDLPRWYPRASSNQWKRFWQASWPHHAHTVLWRAFHTKLPCRERLHQLHARAFTDPTCPLCDQVDTDRHFLWECVKKRPVWTGIAQRFLQQPLTLTYEHLSIQPPSTLAVRDINHVSVATIVACTILEIWRAHWWFIFDHEPFWPNGVVARTICLLRRLEAEHQL